MKKYIFLLVLFATSLSMAQGSFWYDSNQSNPLNRYRTTSNMYPMPVQDYSTMFDLTDFGTDTLTTFVDTVSKTLGLDTTLASYFTYTYSGHIESDDTVQVGWMPYWGGTIVWSQIILPNQPYMIRAVSILKYRNMAIKQYSLGTVTGTPRYYITLYGR